MEFWELGDVHEVDAGLREAGLVDGRGYVEAETDIVELPFLSFGNLLRLSWSQLEGEELFSCDFTPGDGQCKSRRCGERGGDGVLDPHLFRYSSVLVQKQQRYPSLSLYTCRNSLHTSEPSSMMQFASTKPPSIVLINLTHDFDSSHIPSPYQNYHDLVPIRQATRKV